MALPEAVSNISLRRRRSSHCLTTRTSARSAVPKSRRGTCYDLVLSVLSWILSPWTRPVSINHGAHSGPHRPVLNKTLPLLIRNAQSVGSHRSVLKQPWPAWTPPKCTDVNMCCGRRRICTGSSPAETSSCRKRRFHTDFPLCWSTTTAPVNMNTEGRDKVIAWKSADC